MKLKKSLTIFFLIVLNVFVFGTVGCRMGSSRVTSGTIAPEKKQSSESSVVTVQAQKTDDSEGYTEWLPEIIVDETGKGVPEADDGISYDYTVPFEFYAANGGYSYSEKDDGTPIFTASANESLILVKNAAFRHGTIGCTVRTDTDTDSGIVFGLNSNDEFFWEGEGISYYFFFLSLEGTAYLGKADDGNWFILKQVPYSFNQNDEYTLKAIYQGSKICCYVNDEFVFGVRDHKPLNGSGFGVRSGKANTRFSDFYVTCEYLY